MVLIANPGSSGGSHQPGLQNETLSEGKTSQNKEELALQLQGSELGPQNPSKKLCAVGHLCNCNTREAESGGSLGFGGQPSEPQVTEGSCLKKKTKNKIKTN